MSILMRRFFVLLLASLPFNAIANPCEDGGIGGTGIALSRGIGGTGIGTDAGIGGTGISGAQKGIGGTGVQANAGIGGTGITADAGIGGTGISNVQKGIGGTGVQANSGIGGTGIVGVITGFGSICVNGLEIHYYNDTPVNLDGKKISSQALSIGQVVAVKATGNDQSLLASEIHAYNQITGPVTAIDVANSSLKVMGQTVSADAAQLKGLQIGKWVNVSGLRKADGAVLASRVDLTPAQKNAHVVGNLSYQGNNAYLGGTRIKGISKPTINSTGDISLAGVWDGNALTVKEMKPGPVSELLQKVDTFSLQDIVTSEVPSGQVKVYGQQITVNAQT
ncbi:MAG: DUF5666 domain-containing protein, partial [Methylotenera sp.]